MNLQEIATKQDIIMLQQKINLLIEIFEKMKSSNTQKEIYLTSKDVMEIYKISKSHLTDLRIERKIPYTNAFGKILYPKSEIERILKSKQNPNDKE